MANQLQLLLKIIIFFQVSSGQKSAYITNTFYNILANGETVLI